MKTIILLGAGHANLEVLKSLSLQETSENKFIMVSPNQIAHYSGMIPRLILGHIQEEHLAIRVKELADKMKIEFIEQKANRIDLENKCIFLDDGQKLEFDFLSINVGGTPKRIETACPHNTVYLKPFDNFFEKWHYIQGLCSPCRNLAFAVVGGGAAAVETATSLKLRLDRNNARKSQVHLITRGNRLCEEYDESISISILKSLQNIGIKVHFNEEVLSIPDKHFILSSGEKIQFDYVFVSTPIAPLKLAMHPFAPRDPFGFFRADKYLQINSTVFISGDCTSVEGVPRLPKSGVVAVHEGRLLAKNIRRALLGNSLFDFNPSTKMLNILIDGDNSARVIWGDLSFRGRIAMKLKNWIDERYMKKFVI